LAHADIVGVAMHPENPGCPICARTMDFVRALPRINGEAQVNVFECRVCKVAFTTEDHKPITGTRTIGRF
jgi:transposase-like protein